MKKNNIEFFSDNLYNGRISRLPMDRSKKIKRIKQAIVEGTYQINAIKMADKLIKLIIVSGCTKSGPVIQNLIINYN